MLVGKPTRRRAEGKEARGRGLTEVRIDVARALAESLGDAVGDPLFVADEAGVVLFVNAPGLETFGYSAPEVEGRDAADLVSNWPSSPAQDRLALPGRRRDGTFFPAEITIGRTTSGGHELVVAVVRDLTEQLRVVGELRRATEQLAESQRLARLGSWEWDIPNNVVTWSDELFRIYGLEPGSIVPSYESFLDRVHPEDRDSVDTRNRKAFEDHQPFSDVKRCTRPDGSTFLMRTQGEVILDERGEPLRMVGVCEDVTAEKEAERATAELTSLVRSSADAIVAFTPEGTITSWNPGATQLYGWEPEEVIGRPITAMIPEELLPEYEGKVARLARGETVEHFETMRRRSDGSVVDVSLALTAVHDAHGRLLAISAIGRDISERALIEAELQRLADHDSLTGLINRRRFVEELTDAAAVASGNGGLGAVLMLDLDNFKYVNDAFGHRAGDDLLRSVGSLLADDLGDDDVLARLGGDEFALLLPHATQATTARTASTVLESLRAHVLPVEGRPVGVTASIGIVHFGRDGATGEELLADADRAMYLAKDGGRDRATTLGAAERARQAETRLGWEFRIREALERDLFRLHYQPILDLRTGEISQYELLLRMTGTDGELIAPGAFLGVAERLGLIHAIDRWVVAEALRMLAERPDLRFEVNLSALSLDDRQLLGVIREGLIKAGVDPGQLIFEVTETAALGSTDVARRFAHALHELGCGFAIDDFGTGFGSFHYLKHLPAEYLKIDGDFVREPRTTTDELVIESIVHIARGLEKKTVGESVEDAETLAALRAVGVDYAQGFHVGVPMPADELLASAPVIRSA
jgi:diguanylate cyclase (GGDEF)-like protein/PAS domain S-box-containing protein